MEKWFHYHTLSMSLKEIMEFCDAKTEVKMKGNFMITLIMLSGTVYFLMGLHVNLEIVAQYMFRPMVYIFIHLSDQKIKECITAASQMDPVVKEVL